MDMPLSRRAQTKRVQITDAARRMFTGQGFASTSMDDIAQAAGASKTTLYAYFPSKEALFAEVIAQESDRHVHGLDDADPACPIAERLDRLAEEVAELILSADTIATYRVIMSEAHSAPDLGERFYRAGPEKLLVRLACNMEEAMARGELGMAPPRLAAVHFIGLILGELQVRALLQVGRPATARQRKQVARQGAAAFLRAYGAEAAPRADQS